MDDKDLIRALYREGLTVEEIADKFERRPIYIRNVLGITVDPRPEGTRRRFFAVLGDAEYSAKEVGRLMKLTAVDARTYMARFLKRGHAAVRDGEGRSRLWRMLPVGGDK